MDAMNIVAALRCCRFTTVESRRVALPFFLLWFVANLQAAYSQREGLCLGCLMLPLISLT